MISEDGSGCDSSEHKSFEESASWAEDIKWVRTAAG